MNKREGQQGFSLIELILVIIIIGILSAIGYAQYINLRTSTQVAACRGNQTSLETCQNLYYIDQALANNPTYASDIDDLTPYLKSGSVSCPGGGTYTAHINGTVTCSEPSHSRSN